MRLELTGGYVDESGDQIVGVGLTSEQVGKIEQFLAIPTSDRDEVLESLSGLFSGVENAGEELDAVGRISSHLNALGYESDRVVYRRQHCAWASLLHGTGPSKRFCLTPRSLGSVFAGAATTIW